MSWVVRVIESWRAGRRDDELMIITLFKLPPEYPGGAFLLRAEYVRGGEARTAEPQLTCTSEEKARRLVEQFLPGLAGLAPAAADHPTIVMTWL